MTDHGVDREQAPEVRICQVSCSPQAPGSWKVVWEIENLGSAPLAIHSGLLPHSQFRGEEKSFSPALRLAPNRSAALEFSVAACGEPGSSVENAFLILRASSGNESWRIFIRFRVAFGPRGEPQSVAEAISSHRPGFSDPT